MARLQNHPRPRRLAAVMALLLTTPVFNAKTAEISGVVTASRLNVRAAVGADAQVVASLSVGDEVRIVGRSAGWYEIILPENSSVWVASQFVSEAAEVLRRVNLRSGPGTEHATLGFVDSGARLEILEKSRHGWLRVAPPDGATAWVAADHVEVPADAAIALPSEVGDTEDSKPPPPLKFIDGRERIVVIRGIVHPLRSRHPVIGHMVGWPTPRQPFAPYAYLTSDLFDLGSFVDQPVQIEGVERWVEGWKFTVIEVRKVSMSAVQ